MKTLFLGQAIGLAVLGGVVASGSAVMAEPVPYNCLTREMFTPEKQAWCNRWQTLQAIDLIVPTTLDPDPEYITITLENGRYRQADDKLLVELLNDRGITFGELNGDGKADAAVIFGLGLDPDGKAVGSYVTAVLDIDGAAQALQPVRIGERLVLNAPIAITEGRIIVPLLTSVEVINRAYVVEGSELTELAYRSAAESVLAHVPNGTLAFAQTSSYAVRIFTQNGLPRLNLFNKATQSLELADAFTIVESSLEQLTYSAGSSSPSVRVDVSDAGVQAILVNDIPLQDYAQVSGNITYRPRIALPPNAVIEVSLADVSRADARAIILASQAIVSSGQQVPFPFKLTYSPEQIDPRLTYVVQARITVDGQLRFITTSQIPVITQGRPTEIEVVVDPVSP